MGSTERRRDLIAGGAVVLGALLPFLPGLLAGQSLYFRDLSRYFFPLRRFVAEGLRSGEVRWWNPFVHEGEPLALPVIGYPFDLLQALWPDERFLSLLLALHLPLGALAAFALARGLGAGRTGAAAAGLVYGLGGFAGSSVNFYVYAQALAWAPLAVLGLLRAAEHGWRRLALGAVPVALCFSTTGVEVALQAVLVAAVLLPRARRLPVLAGAAALGVALAGLPLLLLSGSVEGSARARGLTSEVVLAHSVHPLTFVQTVVASWHGDIGHLAERWWGQNFFPRGFPYVLSLYLGAATLALAIVGVARAGRQGRRLGALALAAALVCLGRWVGWEALLDHVPALRVFRFPVKAFYSVHLAVALLAGLALDALARGTDRRTWRRLAWIAGSAGGALVVAPLLPALAPGLARWFAAGFFPEMAWPLRWERMRFVLGDAAVGGVVSLGVALTAGLVAAGRLRASAGGVVVAGLVAADLVRAAAGLNPTVPIGALRPSPEAAGLAAGVRNGGGRLFTCEVSTSPAYLAGRAARGERHAVWSTWAMIDTLTPYFNVPLAVPAACSIDLTMLVPEERVLRPDEGCPHIGDLMGRLRAAAVTHVATLDPLSHPELALDAVMSPPALDPLRVYVYRLSAPVPRVGLIPDAAAPAAAARAVVVADRATHVELSVETAAPATLVLRDALAPGWSARVDGRRAEITPIEGWHRAVAVPAGRSAVAFDYRPPRLALGLALSAAAAVILAALWLRPSGAAARSPARA